MTCHLSDARIWASIQDVAKQTGWHSADLLIDTVSEREGVDRDRVQAVYVVRTTMQVAG